MYCPTHRIGRHARIAIMSAAVLIGFAPLVSAGETAGNATLGVVLDRLMAQVKETEGKAADGVDVEQIRIADKISLALQEFRQAYASTLVGTVATLSPAEGTLFNSLNSAADELVDHTYASASALEDKTDGIVRSLSFPRRFPELSDYSPKYLARGSGTAGAEDLAATLIIRGYLHDLSRPGYDATITVAGNPIVGSANSPNAASFEIPSKTFSFDKAKPAIVYLKLDVPYRTGRLGLITHKANAEYELPMVVLPASPGKVVITFDTRKQIIEEKQAVSAPMRQESVSEDIRDGGQNGYLAIHMGTRSCLVRRARQSHLPDDCEPGQGG